MNPGTPDWRQDLLRRDLAETQANFAGLDERLGTELARAATILAEALRGEGTVFFAGNGGSASQAQHLATELAVKLDRERRPFRGIALGANAPLLTAAANDLGYENVWVRELSALARRGDALVLLTTSGRSPNIARAAAEAGAMNLRVVGLLGRGGGAVRQHCEVALLAPGEGPQRIQEVHLFLGHLLCQMVEAEMLGWQGGAPSP